MPASIYEKLIILFVPLDITFNFGNPKFPICFNFRFLF